MVDSLDPLRDLIVELQKNSEPDVTQGEAPAPERVVLFADMLGFAALTEEHPLDVRQLQAKSRPLSVTLSHILRAQKNPLTEKFGSFHFSLRSVIELAAMRWPITAITFSDSAFFATARLCQACQIASDLARSTLRSRVLVRMGIGFGSFAALRFTSDVALDGGNHSAQFLGTAVVRAHTAEQSGIKGARVLLHPSVEPLLSDTTHNPPEAPVGVERVRTMECPPADRANGVDVRYELDYWNVAVTEEAETWRALQDMWDAAPESEAVHYEATAGAVDRMRIARGHEPLNTLRRRTLPRRP